MLTKDMRDVVAMLKRHAVWNETQAATAARGGETIGGLREQEYAAAAVALRDAVFAIESGEYVGASKESGNVER